MLRINKPYICVLDDVSRLNCEIDFGDGSFQTIWFETSKEYGSCFCDDLIDGIVVNVLLYCIEHGLDIYSETPMSEKLHYQLTQYLIPFMCNNSDEYSEIKINVPLSNVSYPEAKAVGTGLSGGVDSFYTIAKHLNCEQENYRLTHLTFFNAGASGNFGGDEARRLFKARMETVKGFAEEHGLGFIFVDTNINEHLNQMHHNSHTFRSLALPLLLQKLFGNYYYSSGFTFTEFTFSKRNPAAYDLLILQSISNQNLTFYSCGGETTGRLEKVSYITQYAPTYSYLNVCIREEKNCGRCKKCVRTMLELYALQKLDLYKDVFDLEYFYSHLPDYMAEVLAKKNVENCYEEIYEQLKRAGLKIPVLAHFKSIPQRIVLFIKALPLVRRLRFSVRKKTKGN